MSEREQKRAEFHNEKKSSNKLIIPVVVVLIAVAGVAGWLLSGGTATSAPSGLTTVSPLQDGTVRFAASEFADGKARFFRYESQRGAIDFFVVRSNDGVIRAAFDSCDVCYKALKGYRQEGEEMVCNNCNMRFRTELVNEVKGGCNPAPLNRRQVGQEIVIAARDIEQGGRYFLIN